MPLQYRIQFRLDDTKDLRGRKTAAQHRPAPNTCSKAHSAERRAERAAEDSLTPRPDPVSIFRGRTSADALDKVTLPAGYCVFYTRGAGVPLTQADQQGGKPVKHKVLGVVDPSINSHQIVEEEYGIIREVVEMYLEQQVSGKGSDAKYCVGGQLEHDRDILEKLAETLPPAQQPPRQNTVPDEATPEATKDTDSEAATGDNTRPPQAGKAGRRCLLPISKAMQADTTPRGLLVVEGQGTRGKESARGEGYEEGRGSGTMHSRTTPSGGSPGRRSPRMEPVSEEDLPGESILTVGKIPLSSRDEDKQQLQLERGFDVIRNVFQKYPDPDPEAEMHRFTPYRTTPLEVVSHRSTMAVRAKRTPRDQAGMTPVESTTPSGADLTEPPPPPPSLEPASAAFQRSKYHGKGRYGPQHWDPVTSRRGLRDSAPTPRNVSQAARLKEEAGEGGQASATRPARVVLNVVLPREDRSREGRLCGRNVSSAGSLHTGPHHSLQAWLGRAPSPPPPPPPSAPADDERDGLCGQDLFLPDMDDYDHDGDDDVVTARSRDDVSTCVASTGVASPGMQSTDSKLRVPRSQAAASPVLSLSSAGESRGGKDEGAKGPEATENRTETDGKTGERKMADGVKGQGKMADGVKGERKVVIKMPMTPASDGDVEEVITQMALLSADSAAQSTTTSPRSATTTTTTAAIINTTTDATTTAAANTPRQVASSSPDTHRPPSSTARSPVPSQRALKLQKQIEKQQQEKQQQQQQQTQKQQQYLQQKQQQGGKRHQQGEEDLHQQKKQEAEQRLAQKQQEALKRQQQQEAYQRLQHHYQEAHQRLQQHQQDNQQRLQPKGSRVPTETLQAAHCDVLGPHLCKDCETARHRQQFTARQDLLYPHIDVYPRSLIASQRLQGRFLPKGEHASTPGRVWSRLTPRWPYIPLDDLTDVVTDLDLCKRIVDKGHRAKMPPSLK